MSRRSVSQLNTYTRCGEQYRLERLVKDLPARPAAWTALGSGFHAAYEMWELSGRQGSLAERFINEYNTEIIKLQREQPDLGWWTVTPRVKGPERDIELRREHGIKQAIAYEEHCRQSSWTLWTLPSGAPALEVPLTVHFGDVQVVMYVDCVLKWRDGSVTVRDIKTGNKKNTQLRQLGLYRLALQETYGLTIKLGEFWYTKLGESGGYVSLDRYTREYLTDQYTKLNLGIENGIFLANPGDACHFCGVRPWCREMGLVGEAQ